MIHRGLEPISDALSRLGLGEKLTVVPVPSGYPAPKFVQLVVLREGGRTLLFESSAGDDEHFESTVAGLRAAGVERVDALLCTHTHGDHAGAAGRLAAWGQPDGLRAPIYLHSSGHRMVTCPDLAFMDENFDIMTVRSHRAATRFDELFSEAEQPKQLRPGWQQRYAPVPRSALRFVDRGALPSGIAALHVPGHADDCVMYVIESAGVAIPGDTVLTSGAPADPASWRFVVPPFTVVDQKYSRGVEAFLLSLGRIRQFFELCRVRTIIPPHGRFAVVEPMAWYDATLAYFETLYAELIGQVLEVPSLAAGFAVVDASSRISHAQAEPMSVTSHLYGLICLLAEEGVLSAREDPRSRHIRFARIGDPPKDLIERLVHEDRSPLRILRGEDG